MDKTQARGPTQTAKTEIAGKSWTAKSSTARALKILLFLGPLVLSLLFSFWAARRFPPEALGMNRWVWWFGLLACSVAITRWLEILFVRFTPLATLFQLSLVFPDQAPSRFSMALRAGSVRGVQRKLEEVEATGRAFTDDETYASQMLDLVRMLSMHDRMTRGHAERVRAYSELIGEEMGLTSAELDKLRWGALLHDMGKLDVPSEILNKPGRPDEDEWKILQNHPAAARGYLEPLREWLGEWVHAADGHHERWDGGGYPDGLAGTNIPRAARIVSVADAFDVMTSTRSYKQAMSLELGRQEVADKAGSQFDPEVARAFLKVSLGDIRRAAGPWSWLTGLPGLQQIPLAAASQQVVTSITAATAVVVGGTMAAALPPEPVPVAVAFADAEISAGDISITEEGEVQTDVRINGDGPFTVTVRGGDDLVNILIGTEVAAEGGVRIPLAVTGIENASGSAPLVITACNADGCLEPKSIVLNVAPVNDEPSIGLDPVSVVRGEAIRFRLVAVGDAESLDALTSGEHPIFVGDVDGDLVTISSIDSVSQGAARIAGDTLEFTHDGSVLPGASVRVTFSDGTTTIERLISITVTNPNTPPTLVIGDASLNETATPGTAVTTAIASDAESDPITYSLVSSDAPFAINSTTGTITTTEALSYDVATEYTVSVSAADPWGDTTTVAFVITVLEVQYPPTLDGVSPVSLAEDVAIGTIAATAQATDPDGDLITFSLNDPSGLFSIDPRAGEITTAATLDFESLPVVALAITATDTSGANSSTPLQVTISDVNEAPRVLAPTLSVAVPENESLGAVLTTLVVSDPEEGIVTYATKDATLPFGIDPNSGVITLTSPLDHESTPTIALEIVATDNGSPAKSATHVVMFTVGDIDEEPEILTTSLTISEGLQVGEPAGSVEADDPEDGQLSWRIVGGDPDGILAINPDTGELSLDQQVDHEATPNFPIEIEVSDGLHTVVTSFTVSVGDQNEPPLIEADQQFYIDESSVDGDVVDVVLADDPESDGITFEITGGNLGDVFSIDLNSGEISVAGSLDFEGINVYQLAVTATDDNPTPLSSTMTVQVSVTDGTEPPNFIDQTLSVNENSTAPQVVGPIVADDPDAGAVLTYQIIGGDPSGNFTLDIDSGILSVSPTAVLDHEATSEQVLQIEVFDGIYMVTADVTVETADVNEPPIADIPTVPFVFDENSSAANLPLIATDPENDQLSWEILAGDPDGYFALGSSGDLRPIVPIDFEQNPSFTLTIKSYEVGNHSNSHVFTLDVDVTDVDEAPIFTTGSSFFVNEDAVPGHVVGSVQATDQEGEDLLYSIDSGPFGIDANTGEITITSAIDHEGSPSYLLGVTVTDEADPTDRSTTQSILITVDDVNDAPVVVAPADTTLPETAPSGTVAGVATATDQDNDTFALSVIGGPFDIAADGTITTNGPLDFETVSNYTLTITAAETQPLNPLSTSTTLNVAVSDANDAATIPAGQAFSVDENVDPLTTFLGPIVINDDDASPSWTITVIGGDPFGQFSIADDGDILLTTSPDHEAGETYVLDVQVVDGPHTIVTQITVTINDLNEVPTASAAGTFSFPEDTATPVLAATVSGVDPEGVGPTYSFDITPPGFPFSIDGTTGEINLVGPLDFETAVQHTTTIVVTDGVNDTLPRCDLRCHRTSMRLQQFPPYRPSVSTKMLTRSHLQPWEPSSSTTMTRALLGSSPSKAATRWVNSPSTTQALFAWWTRSTSRRHRATPLTSKWSMVRTRRTSRSISMSQT